MKIRRHLALYLILICIILILMQDKDLFKQLNTLKSIKPDRVWKERNREILFKQISAGNVNNNVKISFFNLLDAFISQSVSNIFAQPTYTFALILFFVLGAGAAGMYASQNTKPGDSLYSAKLLSEKTQLALTFNEAEKVKLNLAFAGNRAKELAQVLKEENNEESKKDKIDELAISFKKDIEAAKSRLDKIAIKTNNSGKNQAAVQPKSGKNDSAQKDETLSEEDNLIFGANLGKSEQGMKIAEGGQAATSSQIIAGGSDQGSGALKALEEAEKLFNEQNCQGALNKLGEVDALINDSGDQEVKNKDIKNTATSSGEVLGVNENREETASTTEVNSPFRNSK